MTIREKLIQAEKRERSVLKWFIWPAVAFVLVGLFRLDLDWYYWTVLLVPLVGLGRYFWRMTETTCPRCQQPLGHATGYDGEATWQYQCPHCHLGPDEDPTPRTSRG